MESPSEGIPQTSDAPSASVPASDAPHDCSPPCDDITLLVITLNEGILPLSSSVATSALNAALEGNTHVCGVVMARQETVDAISTASWDEALAASGFGQKLVCERKEGNDHKFNALCIYGRNADDIKVLDIFVTGAANIEKKPLNEKGGVVALMDCKGCKICFGGFHCDGNIPSDLERTAQLPAAVLRTWGRGHEADVALFVGDINCTMDPKNVDSSKESSNAQVCGELLAADIAILRASVEKKGLKELSSDLRDRLETGLANKVDRNELMKSLDSCPSVLQVERSSLRHDVLWSEMTEPEEKMAECGITELLLQEMPQGSFPTYRMTSRDDKGWNAIKEARKAEHGGAGAGSELGCTQGVHSRLLFC